MGTLYYGSKQQYRELVTTFIPIRPAMLQKWPRQTEITRELIRLIMIIVIFKTNALLFFFV